MAVSEAVRLVVHPIEGPEDSLLFFRRDADPLILHPQGHPRGVRLHGNPDATAWGRVGDGVLQQVPQNRFDLGPIPQGEGEVRRSDHLEVVLRGEQGELLDHVTGDGRQRNGFLPGVCLSLPQADRLEHLVGQLVEAQAVGLNQGDHLRL